MRKESILFIIAFLVVGAMSFALAGAVPASDTSTAPTEASSHLPEGFGEPASPEDVRKNDENPKSHRISQENLNSMDGPDPGPLDVEEESEILEKGRIGFFENIFDRLQLAFTFNKEKKAELALKMAEKRLALAESLAEKEPEKAEKAREQYESFIARAEGSMEEIESSQTNNAKGSEEALIKIVNVQNRLNLHRKKIKAIHAQMLDKLEADGATKEEIFRVKNLYERASERADMADEKSIQNMEIAKKKYRALTEKSNQEIAGIVVNLKKDRSLEKTGKQMGFSKPEAFSTTDRGAPAKVHKVIIVKDGSIDAE